MAEFLAVRSLRAVVDLLPDHAAVQVGRALGWLAYQCDRRHRRVAEANLRMAFGGSHTRREIAALVRQCFTHFGLSLVESLRLSRMISRGRLTEHVSLECPPEAFAALRSGRGALIVAAHQGNWELTGMALAQFIRPTCIVAQPMKNPFVNRYVNDLRRTLGQRVLPTRAGLREVIRELQRGSVVGIVMDQDARRRGIFVDFFGQPASTFPTAAALALKLGLPIITVHPVRDGRRFRHRIVLRPPIYLTPTGDRDADVREGTQRLTEIIEAFARQHPEQYFWFHRRWKTRPVTPAGSLEPDRYPRA